MAASNYQHSILDTRGRAKGSTHYGSTHYQHAGVAQRSKQLAAVVASVLVATPVLDNQRPPHTAGDPVDCGGQEGSVDGAVVVWAEEASKTRVRREQEGGGGVRGEQENREGAVAHVLREQQIAVPCICAHA